MDPRLAKKLQERGENGTLRNLSNFKGQIDFISNDYFGLASYEVDSSGTTFGSTGSRLLAGHSIEAENCERFLADYFSSPSALVFNSGYSANLGLVSALAQRNDTILYDEYVHASIRDGIRLSLAKSYSFKHNDLNDLEKKLKASKGTVYVLIEGLYSMNGDFCPLEGLVDLAKFYKAYVILDEAHSAGVVGPQGRGMAIKDRVEGEVFARVITFGKAFGRHGACVLGSKKLVQYLINFSRPFIYTTALPPKDYYQIEQVIRNNDFDSLQIKLKNNIHFFRNALMPVKLTSAENSPIQMIHFQERNEIVKCVENMNEAQLATKPIYYPTVPLNQEGIRICIHSFNDEKSIETLISTLK